MGIGDDLNDLNSFNNAPMTNENGYLENNITANVSVYEGPGTGGDSGAGILFCNAQTHEVLQNGTYVVKLAPGDNIFSSRATGDIDPWEDKWVDVKYYNPILQREENYHVHVGNNTPDAVLQFGIIPSLDVPNVISGNPNDLYSYGNVSSNIDEYFGSNSGYTSDDFFSEFRSQGDLPWVGNPLDWGDDIYNYTNNLFGGGWIGGFAGGLAEGLIAGGGMAIAGTGFAISKSVERRSFDPLKYWGETMIDGAVHTLFTPYRAYNGETVTSRDWGNFASIFVGVKGAKAGWKGMSKIGDRYRTRNLPKLPAENYIHPDAMDASKPVFPAAKSFNELRKSFEESGNNVITYTPNKIAGNVVGDSRKGYYGLEDSGIYVAPKGKGNPYFTRKLDYSASWNEIYKEAKKGIDIKWNPVESFKEKWQKYGKTGRVYETQVNKVVEPPKEVLEQPGFSAVNKWGQENLVGTGNIRFTKRSMIGQGVIRRQKYKNPTTGKLSMEHGTTEYEAVIDKGYKFVDEGPVGWIPYGDRRIIVNKFSLLDEQGKKIGSGYVNKKGNMMNYDEFYGRLKDDAIYYVEDKYRLNIDSSLHYIKPSYDTKYNGNDYANSYIEDYKYPTNMDYPINTPQPANYPPRDLTKIDYSIYTPSDYPTPTPYPTPSPSDYPTPTPYPTPSPSDYPMPIPHPTPTPSTYYFDSSIGYPSNNYKKKKKKKDNENNKVKFKKYKQGAAKSKRSWYVKDLDEAFKSAEKQAKFLFMNRY
ncbi:hypothetical protein [Methanothermococcus sp.]|uniref:hypothetical protein n=1 Tax=Methanothermococcus sp. TaxID=2614238 RepID=UPI0025D8153B|nr:hypothetical protein [Methanothermococcus sp.]